MKICVLYFPNTGLKMNWFRLPLGLITLGACLERAGYKVVIIDGNCEKDGKECLRKILQGQEVLFLGISSMTGHQIFDGLQIAKFFRELKPAIPIIWGGWHPTLIPKQTVEHPLVDIVVKGMGEKTIVAIADKLSGKLSVENIPGVVYKENGRIIDSEPEFPKNIDEFPRAAYNLMDIEKYV
ncbi:MAG: B12-binding domain-containing radical SAM protein, partial [Thermodesulfobacteriota bacterium]